MSFPRYERYKNSRVEWVGEVPQHWATWKLSQAFSLIGSGTTPTSDNVEYYDGGDIAWLNTGDLNDGELFECRKKVTKLALQKNTSLKLYPSGSVVIAMYGATIGKLAILRFPSTVNQACCVFAGHNEISPDFLFYWFMGLREHIVSLAIGSGQPNISQDILGKLRVISPGLSEQETIVSFLHREISKIDKLIEEQLLLIELLREKRQAVISHAVTRGLDLSSEMKPSGVEWLGNIPVTWETVGSRRLFRVRNEPAQETDQQLTASQKYGMLFQTDFVELEGRRVVEVIQGTDSLRHVEPNDFVISLRSFQGGIEWCKLTGSVTFHYVVLVPIKDVHPPFFAYLFKSMAYIQALRSTTNLIRDGQDLRYSHFVLIDLPRIPIKQQQEITSYLDHKITQIDALRAEANVAIEKLQERRSALISAVVTGKINVCNAVPKEAA